MKEIKYLPIVEMTEAEKRKNCSKIIPNACSLFYLNLVSNKVDFDLS